MITERLVAQLLAGPRARDPMAVVERLLAVQAQDAHGARLAIRARSTGLSVADVDRALTEDRSLLITWLNRGTLHLVSRDDYPWVQALTTPSLLTGNSRRLAQEGVTQDAAERGVAVIARSLADDGPLTRDELRARVERAGVRTEGQALVHLLGLASFRGLIVRGPMVGEQQAYVLVRDWIGDTRHVARDQALTELARRYLAGHGPAGERDLAKWAGIPLRDARAGLRSIASELDVRSDGVARLAAARSADQPPPPRLLGPFDPLLLGWTSREPILGRHEAKVVTGGVFRAFALVRGRGVATWRLARERVELEPFVRLRRADAEALEADGRDVHRFLLNR
ncbi:MAG TPA: winged helix DNA-binding domain-containing protein [Solirubrobacteraceae bacterium]|nr:winged helix DNA-binding domain-containing protein [Solirubrobacteraceae bacterium]